MFVRIEKLSPFLTRELSCALVKRTKIGAVNSPPSLEKVAATIGQNRIIDGIGGERSEPERAWLSDIKDRARYRTAEHKGHASVLYREDVR